jgi:hypothetical protein
MMVQLNKNLQARILALRLGIRRLSPIVLLHTYVNRNSDVFVALRAVDCYFLAPTA